MSQPFVGEIRMFGGNFAPSGWALCNGQLIAITDNETLFNLIGTTYGGDGQTTFALPDLRGRLPVHQGSGYVLAQQSGGETVTLISNQIPNHTHAAQGTTAPGNQRGPSNALWANESSDQTAQYTQAGADGPIRPGVLDPVGGNQPHDNMPPFLCVNFIISLFGVFPQQ